MQTRSKTLSSLETNNNLPRKSDYHRNLAANTSKKQFTTRSSPISSSVTIVPGILDSQPEITYSDLPAKRARNLTILSTEYDSDNDSTSTYYPDEEEEQQQWAIYLVDDLSEKILSSHSGLAPRPQTNYLSPCNIDFDAASEAWRSNKKMIGEGHFAYKCAKCDRKVVKNSEFCGLHNRREKK